MKEVEKRKNHNGIFKSGINHSRYLSDEQIKHKIDNLTNLRYLRFTGRILYLEYKHNKKYRFAEMICKICRKSKNVLISNLLSGKSSSCRCIMNIKHGANCRTNINKNEKASIFGDRYDANVSKM